MADESLPDSALQEGVSSGDEPESKRGKNANSQRNLKPFQPGTSGNPKGINGYQKAHMRLARFLRNPDLARGDGKTSRWDHLLEASYQSALIVGIKGAADRKLLIEQCAGKAKQQLDLSNDDKSLAPRADGILSALQAAIAAKQADAAEAGEHVEGDDAGDAPK